MENLNPIPEWYFLVLPRELKRSYKNLSFNVFLVIQIP